MINLEKCKELIEKKIADDKQKIVDSRVELEKPYGEFIKFFKNDIDARASIFAGIELLKTISNSDKNINFMLHDNNACKLVGVVDDDNVYERCYEHADKLRLCIERIPFSSTSNSVYLPLMYHLDDGSHSFFIIKFSVIPSDNDANGYAILSELYIENLKRTMMPVTVDLMPNNQLEKLNNCIAHTDLKLLLHEYECSVYSLVNELMNI